MEGLESKLYTPLKAAERSEAAYIRAYMHFLKFK